MEKRIKLPTTTHKRARGRARGPGRRQELYRRYDTKQDYVTTGGTFFMSAGIWAKHATSKIPEDAAKRFGALIDDEPHDERRVEVPAPDRVGMGLRGDGSIDA